MGSLCEQKDIGTSTADSPLRQSSARSSTATGSLGAQPAVNSTATSVKTRGRQVRNSEARYIMSLGVGLPKTFLVLGPWYCIALARALHATQDTRFSLPSDPSANKTSIRRSTTIMRLQCYNGYPQGTTNAQGLVVTMVNGIAKSHPVGSPNENIPPNIPIPVCV